MHEIHQVIDFEIIEAYTLRIKFADNSEHVINFEPVLFGEQWGALRDLEVFNQVQVCSITKTLVWPDDADFDPETLYNWPHYVEELTERAKSWASIAA